MVSAFLVFATLAGEIALAAASPSEPITQKAAILKLEKEWLHVLETATLERILSPDFVHVLPQGFITKAQEIDYRKHYGFGTLKTEKRFEKLRVRIYGRTAIVIGVAVAKPSGRTGERRTEFTDIFEYRQGRWQAVNAQETPLSAPPPAD